jgi:hypothetical protein
MNEENILIIGDDLATEPTNQSASAASTAPANDPGWLGDRQNTFAENFLEKNKTQFQDFERVEREKIACFEQFHTLERETAARRQWFETLQKDIAEYQAADLAAEIFKNMERSGRPLLDIAQSPLISALALIQQHGQTILRLAESHLAALQNKFDAFKSEKQELLKELGLV